MHNRSMAPPPPLTLLLLLLFSPALLLSPSVDSSSDANVTYSSLRPDQASLHSLCQHTPHPAACLGSLKLSVSVGISVPEAAGVLSLALHALQAALTDGTRLSSLLSSAHGPGLVESQRGTVQDCRVLHQITTKALENSANAITSGDQKKLGDVRTDLAAALTNKNTCLEGLSSAQGTLKSTIVDSWIAAYAHVSNSLSLVARSGVGRPHTPKGRRRRLLSSGVDFPSWLGRRERRLLQDDYGNGGDETDPSSVLTVAADGSGNFTTISDAVAFAPSNSDYRVFIMVRAGVYEENVDIPINKPNIVLLGDGSDVTIIKGSRSAGDGWTTFSTATVAVSGEGFLARDISFQNVAGVAKGQAVALRVNADLVALYRCSIDGYQDTLYVHSFRQFYRECQISGTVDFIFGNAAVVFQGCTIVARRPLQGQSNVVTAQSRDDPNEDTGISIQNCSIVASDELTSSNFAVKNFLGRPWKVYSRTVYIESYLDSLIDPAGWLAWPGNQGLDTLYYGEYGNSGPGSGTDGRVDWPGYHVMEYDDASVFSVSSFIYGDQWLDSTSFPYDNDI